MLIVGVSKSELCPLYRLKYRSHQHHASQKLRSDAGLAPIIVIQMAIGAGKTFTPITTIYRILKHSDAKRILFLGDTKNLGEQAEEEFMSYVPNDDNRKFTELYNVTFFQKC